MVEEIEAAAGLVDVVLARGQAGRSHTRMRRVEIIHRFLLGDRSSDFA